MESGEYSGSSGVNCAKQYFDADGTLQFYTVYIVDQNGEVVKSCEYTPDGTLQNYQLNYKSKDGTRNYSEVFDPSGVSLRKFVRVVGGEGIWL